MAWWKPRPAADVLDEEQHRHRGAPDDQQRAEVLHRGARDARGLEHPLQFGLRLQFVPIVQHRAVCNVCRARNMARAPVSRDGGPGIEFRSARIHDVHARTMQVGADVAQVRDDVALRARRQFSASGLTNLRSHFPPLALPCRKSAIQKRSLPPHPHGIQRQQDAGRGRNPVRERVKDHVRIVRHAQFFEHIPQDVHRGQFRGERPFPRLGDDILIRHEQRTRNVTLVVTGFIAHR